MSLESPLGFDPSSFTTSVGSSYTASMRCWASYWSLNLSPFIRTKGKILDLQSDSKDKSIQCNVCKAPAIR